MKKLKFITHFSTLGEIADAVHANAKAHGFHVKGNGKAFESWFRAQIACNHEEISELFSAYRSGKLNEPCDKAVKIKELGISNLSLTCAEEEYADIIIRALDQSRRLGIDIARAIRVKHEYNLTRPYKHGKRC